MDDWRIYGWIRAGLSSLTHWHETHAFQPMHTLARHTSYISQREMTKIAPTNLHRYLTLRFSGSFTNKLGYALPYSVLFALVEATLALR